MSGLKRKSKNPDIICWFELFPGDSCKTRAAMTSAAETRQPLEHSNRGGADDVVMEDRHLEAPAEERRQRVEEDGGGDDDDDEGPPPGWETLPPPKERGMIEGDDREDTDGVDDDDDDGPPPGWTSKLPPPPPPPQPVLSAVLDQMVCGSCRKLLAYTHGARYVKCPCCKTVNFVLEEHQVGQVQCGTCAVLLMYPFGAPAVKCSSCRAVTEIGEHNKRPPWSVQQGHHLPPGTVS